MTIAYNHRGGHGVCYTVLAVSGPPRYIARQSMLTDDEVHKPLQPGACGEKRTTANGGDGSSAVVGGGGRLRLATPQQRAFPKPRSAARATTTAAARPSYAGSPPNGETGYGLRV